MNDRSDQVPNRPPLHAEVEDRLGVLPNFFQLAPDAPEIAGNLWGFAKFAYLDNPLPSLFKERLFVYLSQFCDVRYCIARHVGFLMGLGHPSGDRESLPETPEQIVRLLRRGFPKGDALELHLAYLQNPSVLFTELPDPESNAEEALFACVTHVFLETAQANPCLEALRGVFDGATFQHLLLFITFVRTAHFWTKVHPELQYESDITQLLSIHEALAECVLEDPDAANSQTPQALLAELTELRKARDEADLLRVTLASIGDAVIATDSQARITTMNTVAEELTGWPHDEAVGQSLDTVFRIVNEQTRQTVENPAFRALREGVIVGLANHTILIAKDGTERPIDDSAAPIRYQEGRVVGCVLVFRDVTERRRLEQENAEREKHTRFLAAIVTSSEDAIVSKTLDRTIQTWNASAERIFGYTEEEAVGQPIMILIPEERADEEDEIIARLRAGERVEHFETVRVRKDGQKIPVSLTISPIKNAAGEVIGASKIVRDISDRKRDEQKLREHEQRFRTLVEQVEDYAIFMTDTQGWPTTWNEGVLRVLGFEEEEFIGQDISLTIFTPEDIARGVPQAELNEAAATGSASNDRWMRRKDGTRFWAAGVTTGLDDGHGNLLGFMKVMRDQTERKQMEDELRQVAAELSEADRRKTEFLATLGHELRNPLAPIRTGLEAIKLVKDDPAMLEEVRSTMERQVQQMVRLIDDLLDVSRITRGKLELRTCRVAMADVVQSAVEATRPDIDEAGHELTVTLPSQAILVDADPNRLAQVFSNLLNNSAKYTPDGGRIGLTVEKQDRDVVVTVKDNGVGIPAEMLDHIFEMFTQIDRPLEKRYSGLGIGLTLVKRIVELHNGSIEVQSAGPDQGSEFRVRLPILTESARPDSLPTDPNAKPTQFRILVVDDNQAAAKMLQMVVRMLGNEVRAAYDGEQAVEIAAEFLPDVILMDLGMPKMNGYEAARQIRSQPWGKDMLLVALTGWGQEEDRKRTQKAGFNHHLVKPAEPAAIQQLLYDFEANSN